MYNHGHIKYNSFLHHFPSVCVFVTLFFFFFWQVFSLIKISDNNFFMHFNVIKPIMMKNRTTCCIYLYKFNYKLLLIILSLTKTQLCLLHILRYQIMTPKSSKYFFFYRAHFVSASKLQNLLFAKLSETKHACKVLHKLKQ